ncbi:methyltransferase domain-containing protein [Actinospica robiniae]|uniref:methyltransferase domain-containing protein n=1 Tax=Actinospica robiniae TaxID=304901 RepID=UPI0003FDE844|nr:methyltransferase domain-containing protein [Actinospica robiniae]
MTPEPAHALHERIVRLAALPRGGHGLDLGCGPGPTLAAWSATDPSAHLIGLDYSTRALERAAAALAGHAGPLNLRTADLAEPLPLLDAAVDALVSFNLIECLTDPLKLITDACRVMRSGGRAVLGHTDFDALVFAGAEPALDRKIVHAFADLAEPWIGRASEGRAGRNLPGLVAASPLLTESVVVHTDYATSLTGRAAHRVENVVSGLASAIGHGRSAVSAEELAAWHTGLVKADDESRFFFLETAILVVAVKA